jgi:hypothetical protein
VSQLWNGVECICIDGYNLINGICQLCPINTFFDGSTCSYGPQKCTMSNQIWNGYTCVCINGYFMVNINCVTCPSNTLWNGVQCVGTVINTNCQVGQIFMNGQCVYVGY